MPFVRCSRDKRGYEHVFLVDATDARGRHARPRLLYWFRTPPGVKVGREPFDNETQRALEAQHPGLRFDWQALRATSMPPLEMDWKERRRATKLARAEHWPEVEMAVETPANRSSLEPVVADLDVPSLDAEPSSGPDEAPAPGAAGASVRRRRRRGGRRRGQAPAQAPVGDSASALERPTEGGGPTRTDPAAS